MSMAEPLGEIQISEDVVSSIAGHCALKTPGVAGMSSSLREGIGKILGRGEVAKGVKVEMTENQINVDLSVVVKQGFPIPTIAESVQRIVKEKVEDMTGLRVGRVNVHIKGIAAPRPATPIRGKASVSEPAKTGKKKESTTRE